jgi:hypothetical protein
MMTIMSYDNWKLASPYDDQPRGMNEDYIDMDVIIDGVLGVITSAEFDGEEWAYEVKTVEDVVSWLTDSQVEEAAV